MNLDDYANQVQDANEKWWRDWNGQVKTRNVGELLMLATSELSEALEGDRKDCMDDHLPQYKQFDVEIVDCMIRLLDTARLFKAPLQEIFDAKMAYNAQRIDHTPAHRQAEGGKKY